MRRLSLLILLGWALVGGLKALRIRLHHVFPSWRLESTAYAELVASHGAWFIYGVGISGAIVGGLLWLQADRGRDRLLDRLAFATLALATAAFAVLELRAELGPAWPQLALEARDPLLKLLATVSLEVSCLGWIASGILRARERHGPFIWSLALAGILVAGKLVVFFRFHDFAALAVPGAYLLALPSLALLTEISFARSGPVGRARAATARAGLLGMFCLGAFRLTLHPQPYGPAERAAMDLLALPVLALAPLWLLSLFGRTGPGPRAMRLSEWIVAISASLMIAGAVTGLALTRSQPRDSLLATYFLVAHFHLVLLGGPVFALLATLVRASERMPARAIGTERAQAAAVALGVVLTYLPLFIGGWRGMFRRAPDTGPAHDAVNAWATAGTFALTLALLSIAVTLVSRRREEAGASGSSRGETR